jgi:hypothetical protein
MVSVSMDLGAAPRFRTHGVLGSPNSVAVHTGPSPEVVVILSMKPYRAFGGTQF